MKTKVAPKYDFILNAAPRGCTFAVSQAFVSTDGESYFKLTNGKVVSSLRGDVDVTSVYSPATRRRAFSLLSGIPRRAIDAPQRERTKQQELASIKAENDRLHRMADKHGYKLVKKAQP